jgi:hypothetical protein
MEFGEGGYKTPRSPVTGAISGEKCAWWLGGRPKQQVVRDIPKPGLDAERQRSAAFHALNLLERLYSTRGDGGERHLEVQ